MADVDVPMKQPLRKLEIPIHKFNDVAIPHHLNLLSRHKENIKKIMKDWERVQKEQINASRLVKQLEQLLYEMDTLRTQVGDNEIEKFNNLTLKSRHNIIDAIQEYLEMTLVSPSSSKNSFESSLSDVNELTKNPQDETFIQLQQEREDVERQEACLHAWNLLQKDLHQLYQLFVNFNKLIHDQKEQVNAIENGVIGSIENIREGTKYLEKTSKLKVAMYPLIGALIGTCIGGPVGLIAGLKFGGLTAISCGVLGFTGATILQKKHFENLEKVEQICTDIESSGKSNAINENMLIESEATIDNLLIESKKK
ncbi:hypothetical protein PV326_013853, partial [Microctonus aethiopoides]